jgi:hypothetical protein
VLVPRVQPPEPARTLAGVVVAVNVDQQAAHLAMEHPDWPLWMCTERVEVPS